MKQPKIDLQIGEMILRNLPYAQRHHIAAAVEQELTRLLAERGLPPSLAKGGHIPHISVDNISVAAGAKPGVIGTQIAENVYGNLSGGS